MGVYDLLPWLRPVTGGRGDPGDHDHVPKRGPRGGELRVRICRVDPPESEAIRAFAERLRSGPTSSKGEVGGAPGIFPSGLFPDPILERVRSDLAALRSAQLAAVTPEGESGRSTKGGQHG